MREAMSLLRMVLLKPEPVLLARNLNNCNVFRVLETYLDEQVNIEVGAPRILLVLIFNSTLFNQINSLHAKLETAATSRPELSFNHIETSLPHESAEA